MIQIKRALLSVSDKTGIVDFARFLQTKDVQLISTGGTLKTLQEANLSVCSIEDYTGSPEILGGRVKTLHPKIHGGLLARRNLPEDQEDLQKNGIQNIDLLIVNLYPFAQTICRDETSLEKAIENIDIGGPAMLRGAAKNFEYLAVVCDVNDYEKIKQEITNKNGIGAELRLELACKVFNHTASYDSLIANYLNKITRQKLPQYLTLSYQKAQTLRYGENPHQSAAFYRPVIEFFGDKQSTTKHWQQLQGKELSFNNILDANAAKRTALSLPHPGVVIVKHLNPCGAAIIKGDRTNQPEVIENQLCHAFERAFACDSTSAFGGIIAIKGHVGQKLALSICKNFAEIVIAQSYSQEALDIFSAKKNLRLLSFDYAKFNPYDQQDQSKGLAKNNTKMEVRSTMDGLLYQDIDNQFISPEKWQVVSKAKAEPNLLTAMAFAWCIAKQVKSNAIVFTSQDMTLGIGAGQMSRLDSVQIAVTKAKKADIDLHGSIVASDAFFPFRDGLDALAQAGAQAVVQPGGSVRDEEVIAAADQHGLVMAFTGMRHFLH